MSLLGVNSIDSEKRILIWMAFKNKYIDFPDEYFYNSKLRELYIKMGYQYKKNAVIDETILRLWDHIPDYDTLSTPAKHDILLEDLRMHNAIRKIFREAVEGKSEVLEDKKNIWKFIEKLSLLGTKLIAEDQKEKQYNHGLSVLDYVTEVREMRTNKITIKGHRSHIPIIDNTISGWQQGKVYLISGLEKLGKSRFVRNLTSTWLGQKLGVAIFMLEENENAIHECIIAERAGINTSLLGAPGDISDLKFRKFHKEANKYMNDPLFISVKSGMTPQYVRAKLEEQKIKMKKQGIDLCFCIIDYVQRMTYPGKENHQEAEAISSELADITRDLNVCMIEISQMTAQAEKNKNVPLHTQLRFGKTFKEAASVIMTFDDPERMEKRDKDIMEVKNNSPYKTLLMHIIQRGGRSDVVIPIMADLGESRFSEQYQEPEDHFANN